MYTKVEQLAALRLTAHRLYLGAQRAHDRSQRVVTGKKDDTGYWIEVEADCARLFLGTLAEIRLLERALRAEEKRTRRKGGKKGKKQPGRTTPVLPAGTFSYSVRFVDGNGNEIAPDKVKGPGSGVDMIQEKGLLSDATLDRLNQSLREDDGFEPTKEAIANAAREATRAAHESYRALCDETVYDHRVPHTSSSVAWRDLPDLTDKEILDILEHSLSEQRWSLRMSPNGSAFALHQLPKPDDAVSEPYHTLSLAVIHYMRKNGKLGADSTFPNASAILNFLDTFNRHLQTDMPQQWSATVAMTTRQVEFRQTPLPTNAEPCLIRDAVRWAVWHLKQEAQS